MEQAGNTKVINGSYIVKIFVIIGLSFLALIFTVRFFLLKQNLKKEVELTNVKQKNEQQENKPIILSNNLPETNRKFEEIGDRLAQASYSLRVKQIDKTLQILEQIEIESAAKAGSTDNSQSLYRQISNGSVKAQHELQQGKLSEANRDIDNLIRKLDTQ